jgi:hypothetical protein
MRAFLPLAAALALVSCARAPEFERYDDPSGDYRLDAPKGWQHWGNADRKAKPIRAVMFVGKISSQDEGIPLGAVLSVTKLYRRRADYPGKRSAYERYRKDVLMPSAAIFGDAGTNLPKAVAKLLPQGVRDERLAGLPAKSYGREYEHFNKIHMPAPVAMKLEDVVLRTPEAYFVLEYRATTELFDRYHYAFERAKESFALLK